MIISEVSIHNYRSVRDVTFQPQRMAVLLGPNNHGKSNVLGALEFALSTSAKPEARDFCCLRDEGDCELWVELVFRELTEQERTTFSQ